MRYRAPLIVTYACPRCGRAVAGLAAPLYGSAEGHARYAGLCERCVTDAERDEIDADIRAGVERLAGVPARHPERRNDR